MRIVIVVFAVGVIVRCSYVVRLASLFFRCLLLVVIGECGSSSVLLVCSLVGWL